MNVKDITNELERFAPLSYQESYDNSGLLVGNQAQEVTGVLCTLDVTLEVLEEAIEKKCNLVVSHHPLIFAALKRITNQSTTEQIITKAIKNDIVIYAAHTNVDNIQYGVNKKICEKLNLENCKILSPIKNSLVKLVTFVPKDHAEKVRNAIFLAGAGHIGNYDSCSYNIEGTGTFRGNENTSPFVGTKGELHFEKEIRIETIVPRPLLPGVLNAMNRFHPYEEVAYDIYPLNNKQDNAGAGMIGELSKSLNGKEVLDLCKKVFQCEHIAYKGNENKTIKKIAVCGGSGSFLIDMAGKNADCFITGDIKYHQFLDAPDELFLMDIGHFESEHFTPEIFYEVITEKFSNFAVRISERKTNPVKHF